MAKELRSHDSHVADLDRAFRDLARGNILGGLNLLAASLAAMKANVDPTSWRYKVCPTLRRHPIFGLVWESPLASRLFNRRRSVTIDYDALSCATQRPMDSSVIGWSIFSYELGLCYLRSLSARRSRARAALANMGHSSAIRSMVIEEEARIEGRFDAILANWSYDFLSDAEAIRLTNVLASHLAPAGVITLACAVPSSNDDLAYLEAVMDLWPRVRSREDLLRLISFSRARKYSARIEHDANMTTRFIVLQKD